MYFLARAGNGVLSILTLAIFTRVLSTQEYGIYSLGMATVTMASVVFFQWLSLVIGRFYPMYEDNPETILTAIARGFLYATLIVALLFFAALPFHGLFNIKPSLLGLLFLITIILGRHNIALQLANSKNMSFHFSLLSWTRSGVAIVVGWALIYFGLGAKGALLGFLSGLVISLLIFNPKPRLKIGFRRKGGYSTLKMFRYGLPLTLNFFAIAVVDTADRFMIGGLLGTEHVASYAVVYDLVQQLIGPILNVLFLSAYPIIVRSFEVEGDESVRIRLNTLGRTLLGIGLPATVGLGVLSGDVVEVIFGSDFRLEAKGIMPWLAAAIFFGCFKAYFFDIALQLRHATKFLGYIALFMAIINIILNLILLPRYGVIAAAWSTLASFFIGFLLSWLIANSLFPLPSLGKDIFGASFASLIMAVVLYILPPIGGVAWLLVEILLGISIYALLAWLLNIANCQSYLDVFISRRSTL